MKILWFVNTPIINESNRGTGSWLHAYAKGLKEASIDLNVVCKTSNLSQGDLMIPHVMLNNGHSNNEIVASLNESFKPDVIHIHGTEANYGMMPYLWNTKTPVIHSIQGLLSESGRYFTMSLGILKSLETIDPCGIMTRNTVFHNQLRFAYYGLKEKRVISHYHNFIGRTDWDRAHVLALNSNAQYYHLDEPMRTHFYEQPKQNPVPGRIYITSADISYKGGHVAVDALKILKQKHPEAHIHISGQAPKHGWRDSAYLKWLDRKIKALGLMNDVVWLGPVNAEQIVKELSEAQVHLTPSYIENSPNSTQEAMLQAAPCVISYCGGTPSLAIESDTAMLFPSGDAAVCAYKIGYLMEHPMEAEAMGRRARELGLVRNDRQTIANRLIEIYEDVIDSAK